MPVSAGIEFMKSELAAGAPAEPGALDVAGQRAVLSAINWRLIPLLFFCYVIAYVDRINLGFAKLHLREVLGVDEAVFGAVYGLGAGLFFIGYFLFEVPSNLMMQRIGARIWIARIMVVWGLVSMAMMFIKTVPMFYAMRFLLGAAEAGFFPGVILYLTYWYPARSEPAPSRSSPPEVSSPASSARRSRARSSAWTARLASPAGNGSSYSKPCPR